jgi:hypothetical protein
MTHVAGAKTVVSSEKHLTLNNQLETTNMSQQQKPKSAIQPIQDVLDKGVELGGAWPLPLITM